MNGDDCLETLISKGKKLMNKKKYEEAITFFEQAIEIEPKNVELLIKYGKSLAQTGRYEEAFNLFEEALNIAPNNVEALRKYGIALAKAKNYINSFSIFKKGQAIQPNNIKLLGAYANALFKAHKFFESLNIFQDLIKLEPQNVKTLNYYAKALKCCKKYDEALAILENSLQLKPDDSITLNFYTGTLVELGQYDKAIDCFEKSLEINPNDAITVFQYARALEEIKKYPQAIHQLEKIDLIESKVYNANVIRINLGRLYYKINDPERGEKYFQEAIEHSDDKERTLLYSARSILATNPYSDAAIEKLKQIEENSPRYAQAMEMLTLNLRGEEYFNIVKTDALGGLSDTEMLNRAMYHKIANEISILKGIAYRLLRQSQQSELLEAIVEDIEEVFTEVDRRRAAQKEEIESIPEENYSHILMVISTTAHDISDFVNNQLATIESKTRRAMRKLDADQSSYLQFEKLLAQLEFTQTALGDLKAINEGIKIKRHRFPIKHLFEKWHHNPYIDNATIVLDIKNGEAELNSDEEKIKSALNELVENSLKHNADQSDLTIHITSQDEVNPSGIWGRTIPGEQRYLFIEFSDNGKGVPEDQKDWIFQPLKTTSQEGKGSGLGLFIIRKTLIRMNGYIRETGISGARFELYIPYNQGES